MAGDRDPEGRGIEHGRGAGTGRRLRGGQAGRLENGRIGQPRVPGRARDAPPVRVAAVGRGLDQARRDDRARDRPGLGVVPGARDHGGDQRGGALAVGRLLAGEVSRDRLDGGAEGGGSRGAGPHRRGS